MAVGFDQSNPSGVVMRTKLMVPEPRVRSVPRPPLVQALAGALTAKVALVCAPTGWGKTSLLAEWAAVSPDVRFAWVSLDPRDDEPLRFWRYVTAALANLEPSLAQTAQRRLTSPVVSIEDEILPVLVNDLADAAQAIVLVLDDFHVITSPPIIEQLEYLTDRLPRDVRLAIATRSEPGLRLGRLRAMGEVAELRGEQLRFSEQEAAALLNDVHGLDLASDELAALQRQTEGWVAGLNLAALSLGQGGNRERILGGLPADDRFLVDYLWNEVVLVEPVDVRQFLIRTAILERFSGPLCDVVVERVDSDEILRELERTNLFVVPLDAEHEWFRYHRLFGDLLRRQLERAAPEIVGDLHRRASTWYAANGFMVEAIDHAVAAGDVNYAADELSRHWLEIYSTGQPALIFDWIDRLPREAIDAHPPFLLSVAAVARTIGRFDQVEPLLARAEATARTRPEPMAGWLAGGAALARSYCRLGLGDVPGALALGRPAFEIDWPEGSLGYTSAHFLFGMVQFFEDPDEAEPALREYLAVTSPGPEDVRRYYVMALLAETHAIRGEIDGCERLAEEAEAVVWFRGLEEFPYTGQVHVARGAVLLARGEFDGAEEQFDRAATLTQRGGGRTETAHAVVWLARARAGQSDPAGARAALDAARTLVPDLGRTSMRRLVSELERDLGAAQPRQSPAQLGEPLTEAELRVLRLLTGDLTYREMGRHLYLSVNTVRTHAQRIRRKLGVSTRSGVVVRARELGLL